MAAPSWRDGGWRKELENREKVPLESFQLGISELNETFLNISNYDRIYETLSALSLKSQKWKLRLTLMTKCKQDKHRASATGKPQGSGLLLNLLGYLNRLKQFQISLSNFYFLRVLDFKNGFSKPF
jgi:hypothetical protein